MIQQDVFNQQAMILREYMLAPSFIAIHWLINFKDTAIEDNRHMVRYFNFISESAYCLVRRCILIIRFKPGDCDLTPSNCFNTYYTSRFFVVNG